MIIANNPIKTSPYLRYLILFSLLILGLNLAPYSISALIIIFPIVLFIIPKDKLSLNKTELLINFLLLGFTTSFYITSWAYGYIELTRGLRYIFAIQISYLLGHYSCYIFIQRNTEICIIKPIIFLALGFSVFAVTAAILKSIELNSFFIDVRKTQVPGTKYLFYSTILAAFSSLGICLFPVAIKLSFFSNKNKNNISLTSAIYLMTIAGLISSLMFANRSSFCMPFYIAIILLIYYSLLKYKTSRILSIKLVSIILLVLLFGYIFFSTDLSFLNLYEAPILKRFGENNLGNARFKLWGLGLQHLTTDLWGGKPYPLIIDTLKLSRLNPLFLKLNFLTPNYYQQFYPISFEFPFIHNLWLDIHHQAGIIPFCFLIIFQLTHLKSLLSLILNNDSIVSLTCLCFGSAFILYFMIEPIIPLAPRFFMASCFFLAYFRQIANSASLSTNQTITTKVF